MDFKRSSRSKVERSIRYSGNTSRPKKRKQKKKRKNIPQVCFGPFNNFLLCFWAHLCTLHVGLICTAFRFQEVINSKVERSIRYSGNTSRQKKKRNRKRKEKTYHMYVSVHSIIFYSVFEPTCAHCMLGSYAPLSVRRSVTRPKLLDNKSHNCLPELALGRPRITRRLCVSVCLDRNKTLDLLVRLSKISVYWLICQRSRSHWSKSV